MSAPPTPHPDRLRATGGRPGHRVRTARAGWGALVLSVTARLSIAGIVGLVLTGLAPALGGLEPTVVVSGSMTPRLHVGDVVLARPVQADDLRLLQILLVDDPDHPGRLRLHRYVADDPSGGLVLQGDANPQTDSTPVDTAAVHGVATLRVPWVGLPIVWARDGEAVLALLSITALIGMGAATSTYRPEDEPPPPAIRRRAPRPVRGRAAALLLALVAGALVVTVVDQADAAFTHTTGNSGSAWSSAYFYSCNNAARDLRSTGAGPSAATRYWPLTETSGTTATDATGNGYNGTYIDGVTLAAAGPCPRDGSRAITLDGSTGYVSTPGNNGTPGTYSLEVWLNTTTTRGGVLVGLGTGGGNTKDRALYLTDGGAVGFVVAGGAVLASPRYNDGAWHHVVGTTNPSRGTYMYVDGVQVAGDATVVDSATASGLWRIGQATPSSAWPSAPTSTFFAGRLAHVAYYPGTELTLAQTGLHNAAGR